MQSEKILLPHTVCTVLNQDGNKWLNGKKPLNHYASTGIAWWSFNVWRIRQLWGIRSLLYCSTKFKKKKVKLPGRVRTGVKTFRLWSATQLIHFQTSVSGLSQVLSLCLRLRVPFCPAPLRRGIQSFHSFKALQQWTPVGKRRNKMHFKYRIQLLFTTQRCVRGTLGFVLRAGRWQGRNPEPPLARG